MVFIADGFGQATLVFATPSPGSPAMVTFGFADNPAATPDVIADTASVAWTQAGSMHDSVDESTDLTETRVLIRRGGQLVAGIHLTTIPGGRTGISESPQVAALFQKLTGFAGRNRRGRLYLPSCPDTTEDGVYPQATIDIFQGRADTFLGNLSAGAIPMHLLHTDPVDPPNEVTALRSVGVQATQRRRIR